MTDPILAGLDARELRELRDHALQSDCAGPGEACTLEAAAASLLKGHLTLMRDCKNVLPQTAPHAAPVAKPVSLGTGIKRPR